MKCHKTALRDQRCCTLQKRSAFRSAPAAGPALASEARPSRFAALIAAAARRGASANNDVTDPDKWPGQHAGGRGGASGGVDGGGGGVLPGEPLILKPSEEGSKRSPSGPLRRTSYRRDKGKAEESRRQRAEYRAQLSAASKSARVNYIEFSPPSPSGLRVALVDGYNVIHACPELSRLAGFRIQDARYALDQMAVAYAATYGMRVYVVYDAMGSQSGVDRRVQLGPQAFAVFSAASEADTYIGLAAGHWKQRGAQQVMVVSNDRDVQDSVLDRDYVIYPVHLDMWLEQAHRAALPQGRSRYDPADPAVAAAAAAAALAGLRARRGSGGDAANDFAAAPNGAALPSSRELQEDLVRLVAELSSDDDDEYDGVAYEDEYEEREEEEGEIDYLASVEEGYLLGPWDSKDEEEEEEEEEGLKGQEGKGGPAAVGCPTPTNAQRDGPNADSGGVCDGVNDGFCSGWARDLGSSSCAVGSRGSSSGVLFAVAGAAASLGHQPPRDPWVRGSEMQASSSSLQEEGSLLRSSDELQDELVQRHPRRNHDDNRAAAATAPAAAAGAAPQPTPPAPQPADPGPATATPAAAPGPLLQTPPLQPPSAASQPAQAPPAIAAAKPDLNGLLGRGGRVRLASLVKQATQDLDART